MTPEVATPAPMITRRLLRLGLIAIDYFIKNRYYSPCWHSLINIQKNSSDTEYCNSPWVVTSAAPRRRRGHDFYAIAQHVVFNYEVGTRNYGWFLLELEPLPAIY